MIYKELARDYLKIIRNYTISLVICHICLIASCISFTISLGIPNVSNILLGSMLFIICILFLILIKLYFSILSLSMIFYHFKCIVFSFITLENYCVVVAIAVIY